MERKKKENERLDSWRLFLRPSRMHRRVSNSPCVCYLASSIHRLMYTAWKSLAQSYTTARLLHHRVNIDQIITAL